MLVFTLHSAPTYKDNTDTHSNNISQGESALKESHSKRFSLALNKPALAFPHSFAPQTALNSLEGIHKKKMKFLLCGVAACARTCVPVWLLLTPLRVCIQLLL